MATMKNTPTFILTIIAALALSGGVASAATRQYEGTVVSVNRDAKTFRLHDSQRGTISVKVTRSTKFQRIGGFSGLRKGMTRVEATVKRSGGRWVATRVERSGGGGNHGGSSQGTQGAQGTPGADDPAGDDRGQGADDPAGDDRGQGADDPAGHDAAPDDSGHHGA
jgi:hypothetical protein